MIPLDRPLVIGHRGFPSRAVENTLPSFEAALAAGAAGIECDVRATRDGALVVFHDESLQRLCGVRGRIEDLTADAVRSLSFVGAPAGLRIPPLEDVLELARERDACALVEIKAEPTAPPELARMAIAAVERTRTHDRVAFLSFSHAAVAGLREIAPSMTSGRIFEDAPPSDAFAHGATGWVVLSADAATEPVVARLRALGQTVACYGVDDEAIDDRLDAAGVGLRIGNFPDVLVAKRSTVAR